MYLRKFYISFLIGFSPLALAQVADPNPSSLKQINTTVTQDSIFLDSLTLVPHSLQIRSRGKIIDSTAYHYNYSSGYLHFDKQPLQDSLQISYRVLPFSLHTPHFHKSLWVYDSSAFFKDTPYTYGQQPQLEKEELFASPQLAKSGSISRGVSFGNRQNILVNADLNLQMEGVLTKDINIRAAITDQNIPLQPEGNTQQLQNFDQVYIELYNEQSALTAGDVVLQNPGSHWMGATRNANTPAAADSVVQDIRPYFLRYRRNVQGGLLKTHYTLGANGKGQTTAGIALAKGQFASVRLQIQEGVQGPYRLKAPDNQQQAHLSGVATKNLDNAYYILSNSEKVYLDGQLLQRGYDQDYVIDYNLGEITFTHRILLTRNSRVNIDFEYADRTYSRRILTAGHQQTWQQFTFYTQYFQEKDNPHQTLGFQLSDEEKQILSEAGDHLSQVYIPAVDSVGKIESDYHYQQNRQADVPGVGNLYEVLYVQKDTLVDGQNYPIYVFTGKGEGVFKLHFTYLGEGKGHYQLIQNSVNGKVYAWTAPQGGVPQGAYEPVRLLTTPKTRQVWTSGLQAKVSKKDKLFGEWALSHHDVNTLSSLDAKDDLGSAFTLGYEGGGRTLSFWPAYRWSSRVQYEFVQRNFTAIDPYRDIEFERNWSILPQTQPASDTTATQEPHDHLLFLHWQLAKDSDNRLSYHWTGRKQGQALQGGQHEVALKQAMGLWRFSADWFHLNSTQPAVTSHWNRLTMDLHYHQPKWVPGYTYRLDKNHVRAVHTDSVTYAAINLEEHQVYLRSGDSLDNKFRVDYAIQKNFLPDAGKMLQTDINQTVNAMSDLTLGENQRLGLQLTYRHTDVRNDSVWTVENQASLQENVVMGQVNWHGKFLQNIVQTDWDYAVANGRELKREFVYVRVPTGEGIFTWRDDNQNGIEEIEEFYEARYWDERNYVRVYAATQEYVLAYTNQLNVRMNIQLPAQWLQTSGFKKLMGRFSNSTSWNITRKLNASQMYRRLNPWASLPEEHLLSVRENLRSTLFFNRQDTRIGMDAGIRVNRRKQLLQSGFEERNLRALHFNSRMNFSRLLGVQVEMEKSLDDSQLDISQVSQSASGRNFLIRTYSVMPEIAWQPRMNVRLAGKYRWGHKQNLRELVSEQAAHGGESAVFHTVGCDFRWSRLLSSSLNATAEYITIHYTGDSSNPVSYEMLEALQPGNNVRWTVSWQQKLWDGLQLTMNYQGRKSPTQAVIHTGTMMVKALF